MKINKMTLRHTLLALAPVASALLYVLGLLYTDDVYLGKLPILRPLEFFSVGGALLLAALIFGWGLCGAYFAKTGFTLGFGLLVSHAFPLAAAVCYSVLHLIGTLSSGASLADTANLIGTVGMGLFNIAGSYFYYLIPLKIFEVYLDLFIMAGVFLIGYSVSVSRQAKAQKGR